MLLSRWIVFPNTRKPGFRRLTRAARLTIGCLLLALASPASTLADEDEGPIIPEAPASASTGSTAGDEAGGIPYKVTFTGIKDDRLETLMKESSQLISLQDRPPTTMAGLSRRIDQDVNRFGEVLRSQGFYQGSIGHRIDTGADPIRVKFAIETGPPFLLAAYDIRYVGPFAEDPAPSKPTLEDLGLKLAERAEASRIVTAGTRLLAFLRNEARPLARQTDRQAVADFRDNTLRVDLSVDPGPRATYGTVTVSGLDRTNEQYVRQWIPWKEGAPYKQKQMDALQSDLAGTGLFASVVVTHADTVDDQGRIAVSIAVEEDRPRSVGARIGVSTDRGVGGQAFWRHNNLLGNNEQLELSAQADFLEQRGAISYERPNLGRAGRSVFARAEAGNSDTDAFQGFDSSISSGIRWPVTERARASLGGLVEYSNLKGNDEDGYTETILWGVPGTIRFDGTDSVLDPTKGVRVDLTLVPYVGTSGTPLTFNFTEVGLSGYYPLDENKRFVLAGRTRVASLVGESTANIPPNKRIYAGGGDSIRGYAFQSVGPLDDNDDPIGGRSKIEFSGELRARVYGDFGLVPFFAAGNAYDSVLPELSEEFQWAAGLGFRYHTTFGPLRLDVAFPINRRSKVDDFFQIYFSIGQAF
jgi:translocation and assembly module TamA